jgi:hypothetical protein
MDEAIRLLLLTGAHHDAIESRTVGHTKDKYRSPTADDIARRHVDLYEGRDLHIETQGSAEGKPRQR